MPAMALGSARALRGWMGEGVTAARGGVCSAMGGGRAALTRHRELEGRGAGGGREPPAASWDASTFFCTLLHGPARGRRRP